MSKREKVREYLEDHPGKHRARRLAEILGVSKCYVNEILRDMLRKEKARKVRGGRMTFWIVDGENAPQLTSRAGRAK